MAYSFDSYAFPRTPSNVISDEDLIAESNDGTKATFHLKFSGFSKDWPASMMLQAKPLIDKARFRFNGQLPIDSELADTYCGRAEYIRDALSAH